MIPHLKRIFKCKRFFWVLFSTLWEENFMKLCFSRLKASLSLEEPLRKEIPAGKGFRNLFY